MNFENEKKQALEKLIKFDNSKKGFIDKEILPLIQKINKHKDYYTTSSCAGRIMIIKPSKIKHEAKWLFYSHEYAKTKDIKDSLTSIPSGILWLRMEPPIIHIACRDLDSADKLLKKANEAGFRRPSILSFKKRVIVEIMIPSKMDVPISQDKEILVDDNYLEILIEQANNKLKQSREKIDKLNNII